MYSGTEIPVTDSFLLWFAVLVVGQFILWIPLLKLFALQKRIVKLFKERQPEAYKELLAPRAFKPLGLPNTLLGLPMWPTDSWRQTKFIVSLECKVDDEEICQIRNKARKLFFICTSGFILWMFAF